jgi:flavin-dependent dehydrogenase
VNPDIVIAGGGPAGLATSIAAAQQGIRALLLERQAEPVDKACGEGLLPPAVAALEWLGVRDLIDPGQCFPFSGVRFLNEDGSCAVAELPRGGGLGLRRTALMSALMTRAAQLGVEIRDRCTVVGFKRNHDSITVETANGAIKAQLLVAADGLGSPLRRMAGLDATCAGPRRFGLRRHFRIAPWISRVEVHFAAGVEAYVTPLGQRLVGVAFLWQDDPGRGPTRGAARFENFLARLPALAEKLRGAEVCSRVRGAGPMSRRARSPIAPRLVLVGDAAGYLDAITGEGLSLAFGGAIALARILPRAISSGATIDALAPYRREAARLFRHSATPTHLMLMMVRRPELRRRIIRGLGRHPGFFEWMIRWSSGEISEPLSVHEMGSNPGTEPCSLPSGPHRWPKRAAL